MGDIERWRAQEREVIAWAMRAEVPLMDPPRVPEAAQAMSDEVVRLRHQLAGAVDALAALYLFDRSTVARVCDEQADQSGRLLGIVRAAARGQ